MSDRGKDCTQLNSWLRRRLPLMKWEIAAKIACNETFARRDRPQRRIREAWKTVMKYSQGVIDHKEWFARHESICPRRRICKAWKYLLATKDIWESWKYSPATKDSRGVIARDELSQGVSPWSMEHYLRKMKESSHGAPLKENERTWSKKVL